MHNGIIYEDNHLLVIHKETGELTQGDKTSDPVITDKFKSYLKKKYDKPGNVFLQPAHRLDRPVSGCIILTRTSKSTTRVTKAFRDNKVKKEYLMVSDQRADQSSGELIHWLEKNGRTNKVHAFKHEKEGAKKSILSYELLKEVDGRYLYRVKPLTGRSHQIRVQMSQAGAPIIGDVKYGGSSHENKKSILLHCHKMTLDHPTKKEPIEFQCIPEMKGDWRLFKARIKAL